MSEDDATRQAVLEHLAAFNAHDSTRLLAGLAADARWATGQDVLLGSAALAELFDQELWSLDPSLELLSLICDGERAAAELRELITIDGAQRSFTIGTFFHVQHGLVRSVRVYREGTADLE